MTQLKIDRLGDKKSGSKKKKKKTVDTIKKHIRLFTKSEHPHIKNPCRTALYKLKAKANELNKKGHTEAYQSAMDIYDAINAAFKRFKKDKNQELFNQTCHDVIAAKRAALDKHKGCSELLLNLLIAIPTAGLGLLIKGIINVSCNRHFLFVHKTQSTSIIDEIDPHLGQKVEQ